MKKTLIVMLVLLVFCGLLVIVLDIDLSSLSDNNKAVNEQENFKFSSNPAKTVADKVAHSVIKTYETELITEEVDVVSEKTQQDIGYQLADELAHLANMQHTEYRSYDDEALQMLSKQGDLIAFHVLAQRMAFNNKIDFDELKSLAKIVTEYGSPSAYLMMSDLVGSMTEDKVLAISYFYASLNAGSKMAEQMQDDYLQRYSLTSVEVELAKELSLKY
jgi:hypothetical protein